MSPFQSMLHSFIIFITFKFVQTHHSHLLSRYLSAVILTSVFFCGSHATQFTSCIKHLQCHCITVQPLRHFFQIYAFFFEHSNMHLSQTISPSVNPLSLYKSRLWYSKFPLFYLKISRFVVSKQMILSMLQCIFGLNSPETINNVSFYN